MIALLAAGPVVADRTEAQRRVAVAVGGGLLGATLLMFLVLGVNPRLGTYLLLPMHWVKVGFALILAAGGLRATLRLARPGAGLGWTPAVIATPVVLLGALALLALLDAPGAQRRDLLFGDTWAACPLNIALLAVPAFGLTLWAMRALAPTRLRRAGACAGLFAGAMGALAYTLHCPELAAPFIAVWYLLGVLIPAGLGALIGPRVLRW